MWGRFMKRSIWIPDGIFRDIKKCASSNGLSLGKYLIRLHENHLKGVLAPVFVDSEEADLHPGKYPDGAIVVVSDGHESIIKKPVEELPVDPVKLPNWRVTRKDSDSGEFFVPYSKGKSIDPGDTGQKAKMK